MGMSASQMRFCMIAGKKSDVEFQGQQINQQRTTLATQSSACNTQLLEMQVPTPPSSSDFSTTTYSFTANGEECTISGVQYNPAGTYTINYTRETVGDVGKTSGTKNILNIGGIYTVGTSGAGANQLQPIDIANYLNDPDQAEDFNNLLKICQDCHLVIGGVAIDEAAELAALPPETFYSYESDGVTKYLLAQDLPADGQNGAVSTYYVDEDASITDPGQIEDAQVKWSESGRMSSFTVTDQFGNEITYTLSVTTDNDERAYNDAYNEYEYQKGLYNQEMEKINSKIDIIESQDKKLELKLQDLDTQQKALSTEMDSVKKVIDKNIETSFKTFA